MSGRFSVFPVCYSDTDSLIDQNLSLKSQLLKAGAGGGRERGGGGGEGVGGRGGGGEGGEKKKGKNIYRICKSPDMCPGLEEKPETAAHN